MLINKYASLQTDLTTNIREIQEIIQKFYLLFCTCHHGDKSHDITENILSQAVVNLYFYFWVFEFEFS